MTTRHPFPSVWVGAQRHPVSKVARNGTSIHVQFGYRSPGCATNRQGTRTLEISNVVRVRQVLRFRVISRARFGFGDAIVIKCPC